MNSFQDLWLEVRKFLNESLNRVAFEVWISKLSAVSFENGVFTLSAPSEFNKKVVLENYMSFINDAFLSILGIPVTITINAITSEQEEKPVSEEPENYTFDNYIVGSSNKFAHAASQAVADKPGQSYNPLFIYGDSGLGKTHLLFAIVDRIRKNFPDKNIVYIKGDEFTNELVSSLAVNTMVEFRKKYRSSDVLLIDDIHFIAGKTSTQEEIFHTFNTLYQDRKQLIFTSDRPPKEIKSLEDRLRTRFEWGLLADIQSPDFETRLAIIKRKAESFNLEIDNDVAEFIATKIKTNIRQLEGTVQRLNAYHRLKGERITINLAASSIKDIQNDNQPITITIDKIISEVARTYETTVDDIRSKKRASKISLARQTAMYVVREITQSSLDSIGEEFGGRDHSTVVYAISQVTKTMEKNSSYKSTIEDIIKNLKNN